MVFDHVPPHAPHPQPHTAGTTERTGIALVNLGTPDDTSYGAVRRYLSEFLSDRRVIEASPLFWQPILQGVVLSTRPAASGKAYRRIWNRTHDESPLRTITRQQAEALAERMAPSGVAVAWGMRYGSPSLEDAIRSLLQQGCSRILCMPLYPQYSATTTATANDHAFRTLMRLRNQPALRTLPPFPDDPAFIAALADSVRAAQAQAEQPFQKIVASFHGLPQAYVQKGDHYPADCQRTVQALREALGMDETSLALTYQSRFGPAKWLEPYTAPFIEALPAQGITRIAVITPGFMADCLETLDEIGNEVREGFEHAGGESFTLIPCLNNSPGGIDLLETLARRELAGWLPEPG